MTNLYLGHSFDGDDDIIVDLDKIFTIRVRKASSNGLCVIIMDYTDSDAVKIRCASEEDARNKLREILAAMKQDEIIADKVRFHKPSEKESAIKDLLREALS